MKFQERKAGTVLGSRAVRIKAELVPGDSCLEIGHMPAVSPRSHTTLPSAPTSRFMGRSISHGLGRSTLQHAFHKVKSAAGAAGCLAISKHTLAALTALKFGEHILKYSHPRGEVTKG